MNSGSELLRKRDLSFSLENLKNYQKNKKFRKATFALVALKRMKNDALSSLGPESENEHENEVTNTKDS